MSPSVRSSTSGPWKRALRAERSAAFATPAAKLLLAGSVLMAIVSGAANIASFDDLGSEVAVPLALHAATVPCLVFALIAGAYSASSDRRVGVIDQRLMTDASRVRWLSAKCVAQAAIGLLYGLLGAVTAIVTAMASFSIRGGSFDVTSSVVVRSLAAVVASCAMFAVIGAAVGAVATNTAAVVAGLLAWVLVIEPPAVLGLPQVGRLLPAAGALAFTLSPDPDLLSPALGGLVLAAYTAVIIGVSARRLRHSDV